MVGQILDKRAFMIYFAAWLLLFTVAPGPKSTMNLLGGFSPQESRGLNTLGIVRWNLCVLPPVSVSILFMDIEMGRLRTYTMIRAGNAKYLFGNKTDTSNPTLDQTAPNRKASTISRKASSSPPHTYCILAYTVSSKDVQYPQRFRYSREVSFPFAK